MRHPWCDHAPGIRHESRPHRILPHVFPFPRVALARPKQMVENPYCHSGAATPDRRCRYLAVHSFHFSDEGIQRLCIRLRRTEKMDVVGHQHITPDVPAVTRTRILPNLGADGVGAVSGKHARAPVCAGGDEIDRISHPHAIQSRQMPVTGGFHRGETVAGLCEAGKANRFIERRRETKREAIPCGSNAGSQTPPTAL